MQLVENACHALARSQGCGDWESLSPEMQRRFKCGVRAVLEALRSPDTAMTEAGAEIIRNVGAAESEAAYLTDAADTWHYMVNVLLGEVR